MRPVTRIISAFMELHICYIIAQKITSCPSQVEVLFELYLLVIISYKGNMKDNMVYII